jgi:hypothetical protein
MNKIVIIIFVSCLLFACSSYRDQKKIPKKERISKKEIQILSAHKAQWVSGAGPVKGDKIEILILPKRQDISIVSDTIWFDNNKAVKLRQTKLGDTLKLTATYKESEILGENARVVSMFAPIDYSPSEALISLYIDNHKKYMVILKFDKIPEKQKTEQYK